MTDLQKSQASKILSCYSNVDEIEKGGVGSGRKPGDKISFTKDGKKYTGDIQSLTRSGRYVVRTKTGHPVHKEIQHTVHEDEIEKGGPGSGRKKILGAFKQEIERKYKTNPKTIHNVIKDHAEKWSEQTGINKKDLVDHVKDVHNKESDKRIKNPGELDY